MSFKEFMYTHPDIKPLDKDLQLKRYEHYEEKRLNRVEMVKQKRAELIQKKALETENSTSKNNKVTNS